MASLDPTISVSAPFWALDTMSFFVAGVEGILDKARRGHVQTCR